MLLVALELLVSSRRRHPMLPVVLGLETLSLEKTAFSSCSPGALGLHGFEWEKESLMDVRFE